MAKNHQLTRAAAMRRVMAAHPEFRTELAQEAVDTLDRLGVFALNGNGDSVLVDLTDEAYAAALRVAPNLIQRADITSANPDREKIRAAMLREAKAGSAPKPEIDRAKLAERLKAIPPIHPQASDRAKIQRALAVEQAYRESGHVDADVNGGG